MGSRSVTFSSLCLFLAAWLVSPSAASGQTAAEPAQKDATTGIWSYALSSEFQSGPTQVRVILPEPLAAGKRYPVLYILPVEPEGSFRYGDGLEEARKLNLANKFQVICVAPSFKVVPWYGNHATDAQIRQDDFVVRTLVPEIDRRYPTRADPEGRWLLGFSKSGWGAYTLLFRHPEVFGYAAAWDAPFMLDGDNTGKEWGPIGIKSVFGTKETLQQFLPSKLAVANAERFRKRTRLVMGVGKDWRKQVEEMHDLLHAHGVLHVYRADLLLVHRWDTGWLSPVMEELAKIATVKDGVGAARRPASHPGSGTAMTDGAPLFSVR